MFQVMSLAFLDVIVRTLVKHKLNRLTLHVSYKVYFYLIYNIFLIYCLYHLPEHDISIVL